MAAVNEQILEALGEMSPNTLRALAGVPVEVLNALRELPAAALKRLAPAAHSRPEAATFSGGCADEAAEEMQRTLERVDELLQSADANVVMCFGKWRDPRDHQRSWTWWNGWIDSGGGGVSRLLALPDYEVAQVFAVLGSEVRLAILRSLLDAPKSAADLVADLRLGTTGQAYHHLQELIRTGFVEAKEGRYHFNGGRTRAYFTALAVAADLVPKPSEESAVS